jgi:hypothetical protein
MSINIVDDMEGGVKRRIDANKKNCGIESE